MEEGQFSSNAQGSDLAKLYSKNPGAIPVDDFSQGDRERVLELLLSQERVVSLIYAKTFPVNNGAQSMQNPLNNAANNNINSILSNANSNILQSSSQEVDMDGSLLDSSLNVGDVSARDNNNRPVSSSNMRSSALPPISQRGVSR